MSSKKLFHGWWYARVWRPLRFWWQRRIRGWDDSETWCLDTQLWKWLAPRLRRYRQLNNGYPANMSEDAWDTALDKMIWAVEWYITEDTNPCAYADSEEYNTAAKRARAGLLLLARHVHDLWW